MRKPALHPKRATSPLIQLLLEGLTKPFFGARGRKQRLLPVKSVEITFSRVRQARMCLTIDLERGKGVNWRMASTFYKKVFKTKLLADFGPL